MKKEKREMSKLNYSPNKADAVLIANALEHYAKVAREKSAESYSGVDKLIYDSVALDAETIHAEIQKELAEIERKAYEDYKALVGSAPEA
jgi:hypothetical protein